MSVTLIDPVIVAVYYDQRQAGFICALLEAEGFPCRLKDELTIQSNPLTATALGGFKLEVASADAELALQWLHDKGYIPTPEGEGPSTHEKVNAYLQKWDKSMNRVKWTRALLIVLLIVLTVITLLYL